MIKPSSSILTISGLPPFGHFGFYCECGTCHHWFLMCVTLELGRDGTVLFDSETYNYFPPKWSQSKLFVEATPGERLLISCGVCRSGKTVVTVSRSPDGTSCLTANSDRRQGERRKREWKLGDRTEFSRWLIPDRRKS